MPTADSLVAALRHALQPDIAVHAQVQAAILAQDVVPVDDVPSNCSIVPQTVYDLGTPLFVVKSYLTEGLATNTFCPPQEGHA